MRGVQAQLAGRRSGAARAPDAALLARWWNVVSADSHAERELAALPGAWAAALRLHRGGLDDPESPDSESEASN